MAKPQNYMEPGVIYGRLTSLQPAYGSFWDFQCLCGKTITRKFYQIKSGHVKSCGCLKVGGSGTTDNPELRACTVCNRTKPLQDFPRDNAATCGRQHRCRACFKNIRALANPKNLALSRAKSRAKRFGLPFSITVDDIDIPDICPLLKIPLSRSVDIPGPNSPTLDKIIPHLGYVKGNVWVISMKANIMKSDASIEEVESLAQNLRAKIQSMS